MCIDYYDPWEDQHTCVQVAEATGDVSALSDCETCMKSLSIKDLAASVADPEQMLTKLGIGYHAVRFTDSQVEKCIWLMLVLLRRMVFMWKSVWHSDTED